MLYGKGVKVTVLVKSHGQIGRWNNHTIDFEREPSAIEIVLGNIKFTATYCMKFKYKDYHYIMTQAVIRRINEYAIRQKNETWCQGRRLPW